jgi:hypothetical protein
MYGMIVYGKHKRKRIKKMNKKVKVDWVKALRSGKYKQGPGCLNKNNEYFCCLGVLLKVLGQQPEEQLIDGSYTYDGSAGTISIALLRNLDITDEQMTTLVHLNENDEFEINKDFNHIADYIEENL